MKPMHEPASVDQIREVAASARRAFEEPLQIGVELFDGTFAQFPRACCGDACLLLAELYREMGCRVILAEGDRDTGQTHAWLIVDGLTVDVTADQFEEGQAPVIVAARSPWHTQTWRADIESDAARPIADWPRTEPWRAWLLQAVAALRERGVRASDEHGLRSGESTSPRAPRLAPRRDMPQKF